MNKAKSDLGQNNGEVTELLRDLLITTLSAAGVKQGPIRQIVKCSPNVINRIAKHIRKARKNDE